MEIKIGLCNCAHIQDVPTSNGMHGNTLHREDALAYISGAPSIDDVMSYNLLTTLVLNLKNVRMKVELGEFQP